MHTTGYLDDVFALAGQSAWLDVDTTAVSPGSLEAARVAAGTSILAAEVVIEGRADAAFAVVRPPGHHAEPVRARGFCLFNNVAVAAAHAQAVHGLRRVLIVDWDAHHANGTQEIFYADPDVMLFDTHRASPFYPGSGTLEEVGAGSGEGTTVNVPLEGGSGDRALLAPLDQVLAPAVEWFDPDLILVSAGFDPHRLDLALNCSHEGFAAMTARLMTLADRYCAGRLAFVLEGGYHLDSLSRGVHTVLRTLAGEPASDPPEPGMADVEAAADWHGPAFRES